ncbi:MAG: ABC transporter ATP-binding protein [Candidatus Ornithomonoglobus sp.]
MSETAANGLHIKNVSRVFQIDSGEFEALHDINLDVKEGEFVSIIGNSGCGKSTLLKLIVGLDKSTTGEIRIGDKEVKKPSVECGMVFQEARLYPWYTVEKNIEFGISKKISKEEKKKLVAEHIELVGLQGFEKAFPNQLSGGMQQRVSMARGLIGNPKLLLLDEPFGALDTFTRINMQNEVLRIWEHQKRTMVLVTHDIDEAIFLSDRIVVMSASPGTIKEIINVNLPRPRNRSTEDFLRIRKRILESFLGKSEITLEYYI